MPMRISWVWLLAYLVVMALVVAGMLYGRQQAINVYGSQEAQGEWDVWREDAAKMAKQPSIVSRRAPESPQPPALRLMRDYFGVCLAGSLLLSSVLFGTFMVFVRGALAESRMGSAHQRRR